MNLNDMTDMYKLRGTDVNMRRYNGSDAYYDDDLISSTVSQEDLARADMSLVIPEGAELTTELGANGKKYVTHINGVPFREWPPNDTVLTSRAKWTH